MKVSGFHDNRYFPRSIVLHYTLTVKNATLNHAKSFVGLQYVAGGERARSSLLWICSSVM